MIYVKGMIVQCLLYRAMSADKLWEGVLFLLHVTSSVLTMSCHASVVTMFLPCNVTEVEWMFMYLLAYILCGLLSFAFIH
jgi:hypothetical protein